MNSLLTILIVLSLSSLVPAAKDRAGRPKPQEKARAERQKDLFWFKVTEEERTQCSQVDETALADSIVEGPPGDTCQTDQERFCFCGKKGRSTTNWKFICGKCIKNKPFSFKIERPDGKKKKGSRSNTDG